MTIKTTRVAIAARAFAVASAAVALSHFPLAAQQPSHAGHPGHPAPRATLDAGDRAAVAAKGHEKDAADHASRGKQHGASEHDVRGVKGMKEPAARQTKHAKHHARYDTLAAKSHRMETPCPLHLTALDLTPAQAAAMDSVRAMRKQAMRALLATIAARGDTVLPEDRATMERDMKAAVEAARALLTEAQRVPFDAAVDAHAAEKAAHKAAGTHDCLACCAAREPQAASPHAAEPPASHPGH